MTLQEIKTQVSSFFPGKAKAWVSGKVKEMTKGDLRCKATWQYALKLLRANEIELLPSIKVNQKTNKPVRIAAKTVEKAISAINALPMREIAPNVFLVGMVEPARPLVA